MKILIVDDEPLFLELMQQTLLGLGYDDIVMADSARMALDQIRVSDRSFDCFLLDIQMPEMNGIGLCAEIRKYAEYAMTPIVMVTAMTEKQFIDRAFQAGASDYVTKPIDPIEIKARMSMVERLLIERSQVGWLNGQLRENELAFSRQLAFEEPFTLNDVPWVLPLSTLENYVLRLGNMRMFMNVAIGFHIKNGSKLYAHSKGLDFVDGISEVALAISEVLPLSPSFLSYAGGGDFCAVIPRLTRLDPRFLSMRINDSLAQMKHHAFGTSERPQLRVSRPQSNGLLSFKDPSSVLTRAIQDARTSKAKQKRVGRGYAHHEW